MGNRFLGPSQSRQENSQVPVDRRMFWLDGERLFVLLDCFGEAGVRQPRPAIFWPTDALVLAERLLMS